MGLFMNMWRTRPERVAIVFGLLLQACVDVQFREDRKTATGIELHEKISVILDRSAIEDAENTEEMELEIEECIADALAELDPPVGIVSTHTFRDTVFPDIDYLSVPSSLESLLELMKSADFQTRVRGLGLRYLLALHSTYSSHSEQMGDCFGGPGGGGCLVLIVWDNQAKLSAQVIDVGKGLNRGSITTQATGHPWFGIVLIFPLGFPVFTQGTACHNFGEQVAAFIAGKSWPQ